MCPVLSPRKVQTRMNAATKDTNLQSHDREFTFSPKDFERVRTLIYQHAGINLNEGKQAMVYSRLSRRLRETNHTTFDAYLKWLESASGDHGAREWQEFVNSLTTNLTSFFREEHHFQVLAERLKEKAGKPLRIWCSAASTGEEPYSIAMIVAEKLGLHAQVASSRSWPG
jgi:chemotaxis protein methyltransferase CheR